MRNTVIITCSSLKEYVEYVQNKLGTAYPVIFLSRVYHRDPVEMREHVIEALSKISPETETVLVSMGFCGGSWNRVEVPCRVVIPRVDDCISLLLQTTDQFKSNLKEPGHLYVKEKDPHDMCFRGIFEDMTKDLDENTRRNYHEDWKKAYQEIDMIETGVTDCRRTEYRDIVKEDADWLEAELCYVSGGTLLLEKLISGMWDEQFTILESGQITDNFLE